MGKSAGLGGKEPRFQSQSPVIQSKSLAYIWALISIFVHQGGCNRSSPGALMF